MNYKIKIGLYATSFVTSLYLFGYFTHSHPYADPWWVVPTIVMLVIWAALSLVGIGRQL